MAPLKSERRVFLWRISPLTTPKGAPSVTIEEILNLLTSAFNEKRAFAFVDDEGRVVPAQESAKNCIFIADLAVTHDGKEFRLLINRGDPDVAHPSFINPSAFTVKNVTPGLDEVQGWSAHMVIHLMPDRTGAYRAVFEKMQNVSSTLVQRYFDSILDSLTKDDARFHFQKYTKRSKKSVAETRPYKLRLGINKVPSEDLMKDVAAGTLSSITLIRHQPEYAGPGDPIIVKSIKEKLVIGTKKIDESSIKGYMRDLIRWGKINHYDEIQFGVTDLPGGASSSPRFTMEKADAMDTIYSRTRRITGFSKLLESCYQEIDVEIIEKMTQELYNENIWK